MIMRIGIPRALLFYYYYPFWKTLFEKLGCEVVISDETNAKIISEGSASSVAEICVPIKIFNGHVLNLLEKDVDYVFAPQFHKAGCEWYCPKFIGIENLSLYGREEERNRLLILDMHTKTDEIYDYKCYKPLLEKLNVTKKDLKNALSAAKKDFEAFRSVMHEGYNAFEAIDITEKHAVIEKKKRPLTIALLGYVYNVYDNYVSMDTIKRLEQMDANVLTFDMQDEKTLMPNHKERREPFWVFARKVYHAGLNLIDKAEIDGIIHITAFGCGPDSIIGKLMEIEAVKKGIPFMTMRIDEHTGDNHAQTRLEAFTDMIKMRKSKGGK